jgi:IS30 family transposase
LPGAGLSVFTPQHLHDVERKLNGRPREIVSGQTPAMVRCRPEFTKGPGQRLCRPER